MGSLFSKKKASLDSLNVQEVDENESAEADRHISETGSKKAKGLRKSTRRTKKTNHQRVTVGGEETGSPSLNEGRYVWDRLEKLDKKVEHLENEKNELAKKIINSDNQRRNEMNKLSETFAKSMERFATSISESLEKQLQVGQRMQQNARPSLEPQRPDARYQMDEKRRPVGRCLIINNETFAREDDIRHGTTRDLHRLMDLFEDFRFEVVVEKNLTKIQMTSALKDLSTLNDEHLDCCIAVVLSHGSVEGIAGTDYEMLSLEALWQPFTKRGASWQGKPKVFMVQACQGGRPMANHFNQYHHDAAAEESFPPVPPTHADILICCSTVTGFTAAREPDESGSVYMKAFVDTLRKHHEIEDLESMVTMVQRSVGTLSDLVQQPYKSSTLHKKIYFNK